MIARIIPKTSWCRLRTRYFHKENTKTKSENETNNVSRIRNIGIMAHIDAGKTTTTERMLYYSGSIRSMGEVHHGNTVTDYMEQERQRGITITSAAVTFNWKNFRFNLIDTPGHIDFTMGVEQTLNVLDGAVVILDASAGVEAQTATVWRQADRYSIPRVVYVNKMDRADANFQMCIDSIQCKFDVMTLPVQLPIRDGLKFSGIIDILTMEKMIFDKNALGRIFVREKLSETVDGNLWEDAREKRRLLTDKLSSIDDKLANIIIEQESLDNITDQMLLDSLRRSSIDNKGVPVLMGSSYKNIGVQLLMDAVIFYLPAPNHRRIASTYNCFGENLSARAFKVIHDKQRGAITFFRVYTGRLIKGQKIYNVQRDLSEQGGKLYAAYADDYEEIDEVTEGNIGGLAGLKCTTSGDLLTTNASIASRVQKVFQKRANSENDKNENLFTPAKIPDPVFFCSIEPPSLSYQSALDTALQELQREDPSLRVTLNTETGQTVLGGMGELHIDIIKDRIKTEYKIDVDLGPLQIAYKESIKNGIKDTYATHHKIGSINHNVNVTMSLIPNYTGKQQLLFDRSRENASNIAAIYPKNLTAVKLGVASAMSYGPKFGCPVVNVGVKLHWLEVGCGTSPTMITSTVSQCIKKMLLDTGIIVLEPIMLMEIVVLDKYSPGVISDLSKRRAQIQDISIRGEYKVLRALTPLSQLLGYATALRILSSGNGTFSSGFFKYQAMGPLEEQEAIRRMTGV